MSYASWELDTITTTECRFPKHRGKTWYDVIQRDRSYVEWVIREIEDLDDDLRDALRWGVERVPDSIG